jgi:hypothetical protein
MLKKEVAGAGKQPMNVTVSNDGSMMIRCLPFGDSLIMDGNCKPLTFIQTA